ncbi:hypothetical protein [Pyrobaculum calidifontis]|nr:hypothetical protein [Pyrobaculum calidifontis]
MRQRLPAVQKSPRLCRMPLSPPFLNVLIVSLAYLNTGAYGYMLGLLLLAINATLAAVPIPYVPYVYTAQIGGCVNFSAYIDPLSPWGISSVYVVLNNGAVVAPQLNRYPTPKYVSGTACGDFISVKVDKWRSLGPLIPVSVKGQDSALLYQGFPLEVNGTAILVVKSLLPPRVVGDFVYRVNSTAFQGVYVEEYIAYGHVEVSGYGIVNVTYISLTGDRPDYYIYVPSRGVRVEGVKPWTPDIPLLFASNQSAVVGKPRLVVEPISIPVVGECAGTATVSNPLQRPLLVYVKLQSGEEYVLQYYYLPDNVTTWLYRGAEAWSIDGVELPVSYVEAEGGYPVGKCLVEGLRYYVYIDVNGTTYKYPAAVRQGTLEAHTDLVKPKVAVEAPITAAVEPPIAKAGDNVTVRLFINGTVVAELKTKAAPVIKVNSTLFKEVRVVDLLGSPIHAFVVYVGTLKFYGTNGVAKVVAVDNAVVVEVNGAKYLAPLAPEIRLPTLARESFLKILAAAIIVGVSAAFVVGVKKRESGEKVIKGGDVVEV